MGLVDLGRGQYADAIAAFEAVRPSSSRWIDAQNSCGDAHWRQSLAAPREGERQGSRRRGPRRPWPSSIPRSRPAETPTPPTPTWGWSPTPATWPIIDLETGKPAEALELARPDRQEAGEIDQPLGPAERGLLPGARLHPPGHVATGKVDLAIADMKTHRGDRRGRQQRGAALLRTGPPPRTRDRVAQEAERQGRAGPDRASLPEVPQGPGRQQDRARRSSRSAGPPTTCSSSARPRRRTRSITTLINSYGKDPQFLKSPRARPSRSRSSGSSRSRRSGRSGNLPRPRPRSTRSSSRTSGRSSPRWRRVTCWMPRPRPSKGRGSRPITTGRASP